MHVRLNTSGSKPENGLLPGPTGTTVYVPGTVPGTCSRRTVVKLQKNANCPLDAPVLLDTTEHEKKSHGVTLAVPQLIPCLAFCYSHKNQFPSLSIKLSNIFVNYTQQQYNNNMSTTTMSSKMSRKVSFSEQKQIKEVDTVETDERNTVWYTRQDLQEIRRDETVTKDAGLCDALFHKFDQQRQKEFISALLRTQMEHRQMGVNDPKGLFQLSKAYSKKSKQEALKTARAHEKEVKSYLEQKQNTLSIIDDALDLLAC